MNDILPWLLSTWQNLIRYKARDSIPSGLMLSGLTGIGKTDLALHFAKLVLCQSHGEQACGNCRSCILFQAQNHPDLFLINPEEKSTVIKIDQIRDLVQFLGQTSNLEGFQVAIVSPAEAMNKAAANALLKTLEEPRGKVSLLLLSNQPSVVPATIRSRCQHLALPTPSREQSRQWLSAQLSSTEAESYLNWSDQLPMQALQFAHSDKLTQRDEVITHLQCLQTRQLDPVKVAADTMSDALGVMQLLITLTMDMIRIQLSCKDFLNHQDKMPVLSQIGSKLSLSSLFAFLDELMAAVKLLTNRSNANLQLLLEKIFITWAHPHGVSSS